METPVISHICDISGVSTYMHICIYNMHIADQQRHLPKYNLNKNFIFAMGENCVCVKNPSVLKGLFLQTSG